MALTDVVGAEEHHLHGNSAGDLVGLDVAETQTSLIWFEQWFLLLLTEKGQQGFAHCLAWVSHSFCSISFPWNHLTGI